MSLLPTPSTSNRHGNEWNGRDELLLPGLARAATDGTIVDRSLRSRGAPIRRQSADGNTSPDVEPPDLLSQDETESA